ncbi:MAG: carboxypeptidase regulatory-like domain-containing protein, partial [Blastocatellia bacterium]
ASMQATYRIFIFSALLLITGLSSVKGQTIAGRISGTVTDASGSVIPGAQVTVTNVTTNLSRAVTTDERGSYVVTNLPVGAYSVSAERQGFKKAIRSGYNLVADGRLTVDFALQAGEVTENITVTDQAGEKVNTTSGEVARVIDREQAQNLALNGRNFTQLLLIIPGSAALSNDQLFNASRLSIAQQAINGNRSNASNYTIDGGFNLDTGNGGSIGNMVGIDFIQEVKIQTANFSAEYGRRPGASISVTTRSGGAEFHGGAFEFLRNDALDARRFFAPRRDNLRFNNFGYSLGGPILKNKLFFFGGMEWKKIRRTEPVTARIPTRAQRAGDFGGAIGNIAPRITSDGRAIANVYTAMEALASSYVEASGVGTAIFQLPNPFDYREDILRLDYRINERHTLTGRYLHDIGNLINPYGEFLVSALPTVQTLRPRRGRSYHLAETWLITPRLINEARVNASVITQPVSLLDQNVSRRDRYGFTFRQLFPDVGGEIIPDVSVTGFAGFRGPSVLLSAPTTDISAGDNLTIIHGPHTFKTGALIIRDRKDQTGNAIVAGSVSFNPAGNPNSTGNAFADALLSNFRTYTEPNILPFAYNRYTQFEAYFSDNWRLGPKLNLELGARYHYVGPTYSRAIYLTNKLAGSRAAGL